jgi:hypothetical protein
MPTRFEFVRRATGVARTWRLRHAVAILVAVALVGVLGAGVVRAGPPRADGLLMTVSGVLITFPFVRLLDRALPAPDWRYGAAVAAGVVLLLVGRAGFGWEATHLPTLILLIALFNSGSPRSQAPRRPVQRERIEEQRALEERIRREYPEEFRPVPWEKVD